MRVNGGEGTPVPIPNTVVKLVHGDNTWLATAREDNSMRTLLGKAVTVWLSPFSYLEICFTTVLSGLRRFCKFVLIFRIGVFI